MSSKLPFALVLAILLAAGCKSAQENEKVDATHAESTSESTDEPGSNAESSVAPDPEGISTTQEMLAPEGRAIATVAGGCFWCMEYPFEAIPGVDEVYSGYSGGEEQHPKYKDVARGLTSHTEAVRIVYDPSKVSYELLLEVFWRNIEPTQVNGQFVDRGRQYRTAIFTHDAEQKRIAEASKAKIATKFDAPIAVEIVEAGAFWPAEDYHQDFYEKSPAHYQRYRVGSGRDDFLKKAWGDEAGGYSLHDGEKK